MSTRITPITKEDVEKSIEKAQAATVRIREELAMSTEPRLASGTCTWPSGIHQTRDGQCVRCGKYATEWIADLRVSTDQVTGEHYCWAPSCTRTPTRTLTVGVQERNSTHVYINAYCAMHTEDVETELAHGEPPNASLLAVGVLHPNMLPERKLP